MFNFLTKDKNEVIHINDLDNLIGKVNIIDIREQYEFSGGSLKTSKNIPMGDLLNRPDKYLQKGETYYIMCQSGARSSRTTKFLAKQGYHVINVSGGFGSYVGAKKQ